MGGASLTRVLVVDDDRSTATFLKEWLEPRGFSLSCCSSAGAALAHLEDHGSDLVILSMLLPAEDSLELCREICRRFVVPVMLISALHSNFEEVAGLEAGADDVVTKPLQPEVTLARIRSLLRRARKGKAKETIAVGDLVLDRLRLQVTRQGLVLPVTPTEFKILAHLSLTQGTALTRQELVAEVWKLEACSETRLVDTHVRNIRRKLEGAGSIVSIQGVRGIGYRLACQQSGSSIGSSRAENRIDEQHPPAPQTAPTSMAPCRSIGLEAL